LSDKQAYLVEWQSLSRTIDHMLRDPWIVPSDILPEPHALTIA
jgi:hypothetical protein